MPICIGSGQKVISWLANDDRGNRRGRWGRGGESDLFFTVVVNAVIFAEEAVTKNPQGVTFLVFKIERSKDGETNRQRCEKLFSYKKEIKSPQCA